MEKQQIHSELDNIVGRTLNYKKRGYSNERIAELIKRDFSYLTLLPAVAGSQQHTKQERSDQCAQS